jgi:hypothetical protein
MKTFLLLTATLIANFLSCAGQPAQRGRTNDDFQLITMGEAISEFGEHEDIKTYAVADGTTVSIEHAQTASVEVAAKELKSITARASKVLKQTAKSYRRRVAILTRAPNGSAACMIVWTKDENIYRITSSSLAVALDFEKVYTGRAKPNTN